MHHIASSSRRPVPRGIRRDGPAVLSYGFRPFFLGAGLYAILAMGLWLGALGGLVSVGGAYGPIAWHAHEMLFGYATAALAGFLLTTIPNWTGRFPLSGGPLLGLFLLWGAGRIAMAAPDLLGLSVSAAIDTAFLGVVGAVSLREIVAGRNWRNLKVLLGIGGLTAANAAFHILTITGEDIGLASRMAVSIYLLLIALIGGRIVPSFTRNWLARAGRTDFSKPFDLYDRISISALALALMVWTVAPEGQLTAGLAALAGGLGLGRLARWQGWRTLEEPMLLMLHIGFGFVSLGLLAASLAAMGLISLPSAVHVMTVGGIGGMTLAVMTRATLGHTGRRTTADVPTTMAYLSLITAAVVRPFAELLPQHYHTLLTLSAGGWLIAFGLFVFRYGPILVRQQSRGAALA